MTATPKFACPSCGGAWAHRYRKCPHCSQEVSLPEGVAGHHKSPPPTATAYVVGLLDVRDRPPRLRGVTVQAEPGPSPDPSFYPVVLFFYRGGPTFAAARASLLETLRRDLKWLYVLLPERERIPERAESE